jgi:hypothetical protein
MSRNPPAERRLKKATPKSHASTSQGRVSSEEMLENLDEVPTTILLMTVGCVSVVGENFAGAAKPGVRRKNVAIGAASIRTRAPTPSA